jgi:hypothetical protein
MLDLAAEHDLDRRSDRRDPCADRQCAGPDGCAIARRRRALEAKFSMEFAMASALIARGSG